MRNWAKSGAGLVVACVALSCGGPRPSADPGDEPGGPPPATLVEVDSAVVDAYHEHLIDVHRLTTGVSGAVVRREAALRAARRAPTPEACAALERTSGEAAAAWARLAEAYDRLETAVVRLPEHERPRRVVVVDGNRARARAQAERATAFQAAWSERCAALPPVAASIRPRPTPARSCGGLTIAGPVVNLSGEAWPADVAGPHGGLKVARRLSRTLADTWDVALVLVEDADALTLEPATLVVERGVPGLGAEAPYHPRHLPRWSSLHAAVVLPMAPGLRRGPSLRGVARAFANRLTLDGCAPHLVDETGAGYWGPLADGAQLGGRGAGGGGRVGNGGNALPYADIELYLLGHLPPEDLPTVRFADDPSCVASGGELVARHGARPPVDAYRVGLVLVTARPLPPVALDAARADLLAFTEPGADDDPWVLNYHEATGGRGRLVAVDARPRAASVGDAGCAPVGDSLR